MILIISLALALSINNCCFASYYYQSQPQLQAPFGALGYNGYHQNYQTYQAAPPVQYYTSNHIQPPAYQPFTYQSPTTSYFQRTFLQPQPVYNVQPTVHVQQPSPVVFRESKPVNVTNTVTLSATNTSPQMRGFIYHTDFEGGARSNVVFFSGPTPANFFQTTTRNIPTTMPTPASDSVDTVATVSPTPGAAQGPPADHFQSLLALLNQQPSSGIYQLQDGILYDGLSNTNRVVANDRFLAREDIATEAEADEVLPILRSSFIGRRVTASEALTVEGSDVSERENKGIDVETSREPLTSPVTTTITTTTAASTTASTSTTTTTPASTSSSSSTLTTPTSTMAPIVVADITQT